ncbi:MAG: YraN family protein [Gammaproteobacteria bacterium]|nr:YraN family protein [Gammaproteobacteria bacterium]
MQKENLAAKWLATQGLELIERNVRYRCGEIDLVMDDGEALVFVEVRYRARADFGGAAASVTAAKQARMLRAIRAYVAAHPGSERRNLRADVVAVSAGDRIEWIKNAVEATT